MILEAEKERLIEEFRACLEDWEGGENEEDSAPVDLHTLLAEMAALKNEIRLESRQFKTMLEEMRHFGEALREQNERLNRDLERVREQAAVAKRQAERGLLLGLLDLRDRLQAGVDAGGLPQSSFLVRLFPTQTRLIRSLVQGQTLTVQRMDELLAEHQVRPLEAIGQMLDPHQMRAVGVETALDKPDGQVLREVRCGFYHHGELLRTAEVIVNKTGMA
ncbi:MAG: nucleotide exchange factor GrpE [Pseudomonadota bacterium]|nr:nucleotide exchange factor GrpE [Pseudomonadota bacterium]